jgi:hypothetical protein
MARDRENEAEAVRTTIVGGRPPGSGRHNVPVPRGIEVLVKKAAVDAEFRELLLAQRGRAAASIELKLDPDESAMLSIIPQQQLARIVDQTEVGTDLRPAFMGRAAAVMLAALGTSLASGGSPAGAQPASSTPAAPVSQAQPAGIPPPPPPLIYEIAGVVVGPDNYAPAEPATNQSATNPARPPIVGGRSGGAGARVPPPRVTPPTAPASTNQPATNAPSATNVLNPSRTYSGRTVVVAGAVVFVDEAPANVSPPDASTALASTNQPATNAPEGVPIPPPPNSRPAFSFGLGIDIPFSAETPPPAAPASTNQPATNAPRRSSGSAPPFRPAMFAVMIQPPPPKPPPSNPPDSEPPTKEP